VAVDEGAGRHHLFVQVRPSPLSARGQVLIIQLLLPQYSPPQRKQPSGAMDLYVVRKVSTAQHLSMIATRLFCGVSMRYDFNVSNVVMHTNERQIQRYTQPFCVSMS
jgi:hypothetical protein